MLFSFWFFIELALCFPKDALEDLAHFFLFLREGPYRVALISTCQDPFSTHEYLKLRIQRLVMTSALENPSQIDFIVLDRMPKEAVSHWSEIGKQHNIPVLSIFYQKEQTGIFAWSGTGPKRFQTYVDLSQLNRFGFRPKLPYLTTIHLVEGLDGGKPICRTPNHANCFPW